MKNKKSLFIFLGIFIFMIIPKNVYAISYPFGANNFTQDTFSFALPGSWANHGSGTLKTSISLYYNETIYPLTDFTIESPTIRQISAVSGNQGYICDIGNSAVSNVLNKPSDNFSISTSITYTVSCNMVMGSDGLGGFHIYFDRHGKTINNITGGPNITFTKSDSQNIISSQQATTNAINDNWNNFSNADLDDSDKQSPNTDNYNDYQTAENNLFDKMDEADTDNLDVAIDSNSATWVWDRITEWLGTHALLMSFLVSMLSIGIIKMALGR